MSDSSNPTGSSSSTPSRPSASASAPAEPELSSLPVHVLDLGKAKSSEVKDLKKGRGKLFDEISDTLLDLELASDAAKSGSVVPVVLIVERKRKRKTSKSFF
jgi:Family of unknown function (DUF6200)